MPVYMIRVTDAEGHDMFLRHDGRPGEGRIAQFRSREAAEAQAGFIKHGLDEGDAVAIVLYDQDEE